MHGSNSREAYSLRNALVSVELNSFCFLVGPEKDRRTHMKNMWIHLTVSFSPKGLSGELDHCTGQVLDL